ncbi:hypothetical protein WJT74_05890 [Sphingomicrobium sp. XHP0239]|uniref:hypothetical protein n=1 Tax=Sphingomicrobium maritimum TaxID=3133972 RepID=UPI0031CC97C3
MTLHRSLRGCVDFSHDPSLDVADLLQQEGAVRQEGNLGGDIGNEVGGKLLQLERRCLVSPLSPFVQAVRQMMALMKHTPPVTDLMEAARGVKRLREFAAFLGGRRRHSMRCRPMAVRMLND